MALTFSEYLQSINSNPNKFFEENRGMFSRQSVFNWASGETPSLINILRLEKITGGKVTIQSFSSKHLTDKETV